VTEADEFERRAVQQCSAGSRTCELQVEFRTQFSHKVVSEYQ